MDLEGKLSEDAWSKGFCSGSELSKKLPPELQSLTNLKSPQHQQKWDSPSWMDYSTSIGQQFSEFNPQSETPSLISCNSRSHIKFTVGQDGQANASQEARKIQDWDPTSMLSNLSFLEQKIHQLQDLVHSVAGRRTQVEGCSDELVVQQHQLITADFTSIIAQLISRAGSLLPSLKHSLPSADSSFNQLEQLSGTIIPSETSSNGCALRQNNILKKAKDHSNHNLAGFFETEQNYNVEEHESKDEDDADEGENLPPGSYEILQLEKDEILAPHTHFCTMCGKGFKRDANLRMHMRGHGDEYKTPAALAKPNKESSNERVLIKRYSCPCIGCKRNKDHKKFQPLKTILCVKNHYKRTHCDKSYTCSRCHVKKFSVIADLKTHEKHCGKDKWLCSCGTTFSRKDKLFGHIALFQGHTPTIPPDDTKAASAGQSDRGNWNEANNTGKMDFSFNASATEIGFQSAITMDAKGSIDGPSNYFSPLNFDTCNFGGFHEFPRPSFEDSESSPLF